MHTVPNEDSGFERVNEIFCYLKSISYKRHEKFMGIIIKLIRSPLSLLLRLYSIFFFIVLTIVIGLLSKNYTV